MDITVKYEKASFWSVIKEFFSTSKDDEIKNEEIAKIIRQEDSKYIEKLEESQKITEIAKTKRTRSKAKTELEVDTENVKINTKKSATKNNEIEQKEIGE